MGLVSARVHAMQRLEDVGKIFYIIIFNILDIELNFEEIAYIKMMIEKMLSGEIDPEELSDDALDDVSGGAVGAAVGIIISVAGLVITCAQWTDSEMRSRGRRW